MEANYNQYAVCPDNSYMDQTVDPGSSMLWDYPSYNMEYMDNQEYYTNQVNEYYTYTDDVGVTSWDVTSPSSDYDNDSTRSYQLVSGQCTGVLSSSAGLDSVFSESGDSNTESMEESMFTDKLDYQLPSNRGGKRRLRGPLKKIHQRQAANIRERRRMRTINDAFEHLRQKVPKASEDKKTSKVDTLKLAVRYITDLTDILKSCGESNIPGLREKNRCNRRVVVNYATPEFNPDTGDITLGHSLSWSDQSDIQLTPDNKLKTKLWTPQLPTTDDLKAIECDTTTDV